MNRLPQIGERVRYRAHFLGSVRELVGTVRKLYPGTAIDGDEDDDPDLDLPIRDVEVGEPGWADRWSASVEPDELPEWWPYPGNRCFAPSISDLEPEAAQ